MQGSEVKVTQLCLTVCDLMDNTVCSGYSDVHWTSNSVEKDKKLICVFSMFYIHSFAFSYC